MSEDDAISLAIEAIEATIKTLQIDADLHDTWSVPQPTELLVENFRTPRRITAAKKREKFRLAITALQQMRPYQCAMELEILL